MNYKNKLVLEMGIFFIIVFGLFTYIVLNKYMFFCPKTQNKHSFSNICLFFLTNYLLILGDKRKKNEEVFK